MKCILVLFLLSFTVSAGELNFGVEHNLQYSGYLGYQQLTSTAQIENTYDLYSPQIGINLIYNYKNFQIFNQFKNDDSLQNSIVYSFAQYTMNLATEVNLTIRGGRVQNDIGLYNTTRINPRTRQGIMMPQGFYWSVFENFLTSGDGFEALLQIYDFKFSYTINDPNVTDNAKVTKMIFGPLMNSIQTGFGSHQNVSIAYTPKNLPLILKTTYSHFEFGNNSTLALKRFFPDLYGKNISDDILTVGAEYKIDDFILSAESVWFKLQNQNWNNISKINNGYSLSTTYMINDKVNLRLNYNQFESQNKNLYPNSLWMSYYKDLNIGVNYHPDSNWIFQLEGHYINGGKNIYTEPTTDINQYKEWYMVNASVIYSF